MRKILLVDDEADLLEPLRLRLAAGGRDRVVSASDGEEGLAAALSFEPDVAVVDLTMPGMDGWELCRRLRADPRTRGARLIVMTAWVSADLTERAKAAGVETVLLKPFEDAELVAAVGAGGPV